MTTTLPAIGNRKGSLPWALVNLPPFPVVAIKLVRLLNEEDVDIRRVSEFIAVEPAFSLEVLRLANSALFACRRPVTSIPQAVINLGLDRVKGIAMTVGLRNYVSPVLKSKALAACWRNSLATAIICERLCKACAKDEEFGYSAGLLHDIGRLALLIQFPVQYANVLAVAEEYSYDLLTVERDLFDIDHCEAGGWLIERMDLPVALSEVVTQHHQAPVGSLRTVHIVRASDLVAEALGFGVMKRPDPCSFESAIEELPQRFRARCPQDPEEWRIEIAAKIASWI